MARQKKAVEAAAMEPVVEEVKVDATVNTEEPEKKEEKKTRTRKAAAPKAEKPAAEKKAPARRTSKKAAEAVEAAPAAEKKPARRAAKKPAEVKATVNVQFAGKEYTAEKLVEIAKDVWQYDLGGKPEDFRSVELYVKTEESTVYYVINGDTAGSFGI